jgi:hypothetical protein
MNQYLILILVLATLVACSSNDVTNPPNDPMYGNIPTELVKELEKISPETQKFTFDPSIENTIICDSGTVLIIPSNTIVDQNGNEISEKITVKLKEHFSVGDYLLSNLQTMHNGELLESGGMIYINAYDAKGEELKIADGKSIRIEIPDNGNVKNPQIFLGARNSEGIMNWGEMQSPDKSLAAYPILYISRHHLPPGYGTECPEFYGIVNSEISGSDVYYYLQGDILKYEKTLLATKEFKSRYDTYCDPELVKLYIDNIEKNMWEIDELFVQKLIQDSIDAVGYYANDQRTNLTDTQIEAREWLIKEDKEHYKILLQQFRSFASQKLERVDTSIPVDSNTFINYLSDANSYDEYNNAFKAKTALNATEFGWINLDVIYKDPRSVKMDIKVVTNKPASTVTLILKESDVMVNAYLREDDSFSFTRPNKGYNKLPKGAKAILVAIGYENDKVTFAMKEIVVGANKTEQLKMKSITVQSLEKKLKSLK